MVRDFAVDVRARLGGTLPLVLAAYTLVYLVMFVYPTFLVGPMQLLRIVPANEQIGIDLALVRGDALAFLREGGSLYAHGTFPSPPFAAVLLAPLALASQEVAFWVLTGLTLLSFGLIAFVFPLLLGDEDSREGAGIAAFVFLAGLLSYGLQFHIERGSLNLLAFALGAAALPAFHRGARWPAYVLLTLGIQLKLFPGIFLFALRESSRPTGADIRRWVWICAANGALLLVFGWETFVEFLGTLRAAATESYVWMGSHSIASFVELFAGGSGLAEAALMLVALLLVLKTVLASEGPLSAADLLILTAVAAILPRVSHDYKLPILAFPAALFLMRRRPGGLIDDVLLFAFAAVFSTTLWSYEMLWPYRQFWVPYFQNKFIPVVALAGIALLADANARRRTARPRLRESRRADGLRTGIEYGQKPAQDAAAARG